MHRQLFTYDEPDSLIEIVNIESTVYGKTDMLNSGLLPAGTGIESAPKAHRPMIFGAEAKSVNAPVYDGELLGANDLVVGPAVIEEPTTTIVVQPGWTARLDATACYVISRDA